MTKVCQVCGKEKPGDRFTRGQFVCKGCDLEASLKKTFGDVFLDEELEVLRWTLGDTDD
jgi:hypothetical protein